MNSNSNLPPGCTSADGGIDHAFESAVERLIDSFQLAETAMVLSKIAPVIESTIHAAADSLNADLNLQLEQCSEYAERLQRQNKNQTDNIMYLQDDVVQKLRDNIKGLENKNRILEEKLSGKNASISALCEAVMELHDKVCGAEQ